MDELIGTEGRLPFLKDGCPSVFNIYFSMLGGLVVAPLIIGINPSATMFCSGAGTLFYLFITKKENAHISVHFLCIYRSASDCAGKNTELRA